VFNQAMNEIHATLETLIDTVKNAVVVLVVVLVSN